jgi:hypothetical protein
MSYATLEKYDYTLKKDDDQDYTVSKCLGGVCGIGGEKQPVKKEEFGAFSLRAAVRPPYSQCYGQSDCNPPKLDAVT